MHKPWLLGTLALGLILLGGCGADDAQSGGAGGNAGGTVTSGGSGGEAGGTAFTLDVPWTPCPLMTNGTGTEAECAEIAVPLHWDRPDEETITLFLKRRPGPPGEGQVWFLPGGPGQSGVDMEALVQQLAVLEPNRTYYMIDHRGVGRSTRLRCPGSEGLTGPNSIGLGFGEVEACLQEVQAAWSDDQLAGFSTTEAAHDVGKLIEHLRVDDETVTLWGGSYGTLWLERYLAHYTEQPSAVVFSAIALDVDLLKVEQYVDAQARRWLDACDADADCGSRFTQTFGQSARDVAIATLSGAGTTLCPELEAIGLTPDILKPFFGQLLAGVEPRKLIAPIIYRLARCGPEDVTAMNNLVMAVSPPGDPVIPLGVELWGFVLSENIAVAELTTDVSLAEAQADTDAAIAVQGPAPRLATSRAIWPRYDAPPFTNSSYDGPVLLLHGEYDFLPEAVYEGTVNHYLANNPLAEFVLLPGAPHSLESPTSAGGQCGIVLAITRLLDPNAPLDDCAADVLPLVLSPSAATSTAVFGTDDPWDGVPTTMATRMAPAPRPSFLERPAHTPALITRARKR